MRPLPSGSSYGRWFHGTADFPRHTVSSTALLFGLVIFCEMVAAQTAIFESDFEIGDLTEWKQGITCTPVTTPATSCSVSTERPHSGLYSAKHVFPAGTPLVQSMMRYNTAKAAGYAVVYARIFFYIDTDFSTRSNSDLQVLQLNSIGGQAVQIHNGGTADTPLYRLKLSGGSDVGATALNPGRWYSIKFAYDSGAGTAAVYLSGSGRPEVSLSGLTLSSVTVVRVGCLGYASGTIYFDDTLVSTQDIAYSAAGVRLRHANSFGRSGLPLKTYLAGWTPTDVLTVTVDGSEVYRQTVTSGLMTPVVNMVPLSAADHALTVRLLTTAGATKASASETITKYVSGAPLVAINADNAITFNGSPIFLVTPWSPELSGAGYCMSDYLANGYVNAFGWFGPYSTSYSPSQWGSFIDAVASLAPTPYPAIGPDTFRWCNAGGSRCSDLPSKTDNSTSIANAQAYAAALASNPNLLGWTWDDEPNLGGGAGNTPAQNLQAITDAVRGIDPNHLHFQNLGNSGSGADNSHLTSRQNFLYPNLSDALQVAYPRMIAEVYSSDYYPFIYQKKDSATLATWLSTLDSLQKYTFGLVPWMSFIEAGIQRCYDPPACLNGTGSGAPAGIDPGLGPTADQLKMEAWLAVIHGMKGTSWWGPEQSYYTYIDADHKAAMAAFTSAVTTLRKVILSGVPARTVTTNSTRVGNRVDAMVRDSGSDVWVFAARVTECEPGSTLPLACESNTISTEFMVSGLSQSRTVSVWGESRSVSALNGVFSDSFAPNTVHIYQIPGVVGAPGQPSSDSKVAHHRGSGKNRNP